MAGDVDHVVDAAENAIVAVGRLQRAVAGEVRPIAPILAVRVFAVARVILRDKAVGIAPDGLEYSGPRIADADIARPPEPRGISFPSSS
jgi:hypothetical protein